jgi:hypothetical protein
MATSEGERVMRGNCNNSICEYSNMAVKVHEDFEDLEFTLCWKCGSAVIDNMKERYPKWDLSSS